MAFQLRSALLASTAERAGLLLRVQRVAVGLLSDVRVDVLHVPTSIFPAACGGPVECAQGWVVGHIDVGLPVLQMLQTQCTDFGCAGNPDQAL